jgi:hypothetical protein
MRKQTKSYNRGTVTVRTKRWKVGKILFKELCSSGPSKESELQIFHHALGRDMAY